jgi:hypothetical protein
MYIFASLTIEHLNILCWCQLNRRKNIKVRYYINPVILLLSALHYQPQKNFRRGRGEVGIIPLLLVPGNYQINLILTLLVNQVLIIRNIVFIKPGSEKILKIINKMVSDICCHNRLPGQSGKGLYLARSGNPGY